ncbi:Protein O-mannosyltransferase 2 [Coemansia sp. RSA 552]|nr:Protein O-mannosyltransferase 2 [Coemansia sp. RSA 552]
MGTPSAPQSPGLRRRRRRCQNGSQQQAAEKASATAPQPSTDKGDGSPAQPQATAFGGIDHAFALGLTALSLLTRLYRIGRRSKVSWDEAHFGKFGAYYINGTFYHDVHPPLAKMLVGLVEVLSGFNGTFNYKGDYPPHVNYVLQRSFLALYGMLIVPFAYYTGRCLGFTRAGAVAAASFVLLDNSLTVISRFILLDPILLCFIAMSLLGYAGFAARRQQPFSATWWGWLIFTGVSLGMTISSKWVGAFVIMLVGLCTIEELLAIYAQHRAPVNVQARHWMARIACLIALPLAVYFAAFQIHFALLRTRGVGDFKMPSDFQALQRNNVVSRQSHDVALGSQITLRSHLPGFGLVNANQTIEAPGSMADRWAVGGMGGKQAGNWWWIVPATANRGNKTWRTTVQHIQDGGHIRFFHTGSERYLRTGILAPTDQKGARSVFAGGNKTSTSVWDDWRVRVVGEVSPRRRGQLYTVTTHFQLTNVHSGCLLKATSEQLPVRDAKLSRLVCISANSSTSEGTLWNIEQTRDKRLKATSLKKLVRRRPLRDTVWLNREMARSNNNLIPDPDRYKPIESDPWTWPLLLRPMRMVAWTDSSIKYYEIGNPVLYWASTLCCVLYPLQLLYWLTRWQRGYRDWGVGEFRRFWDTSKLLWGGWVLHYAPFLFMGRVTYLHHYLPALYFALLLLAFEMQCLIRWFLPPRAMWPVMAAAVAAVGYVFVLFSPFTYGWDRPARELAHLAWLPQWNIVDDPFLR